MKILVRVYNQSRWSFLILGLGSLGIGVYGLINPEDISFTNRSGLEVSGKEEIETLALMLLIGVVFLFIRLRFMKYRKNDDFSDDIPLPVDVSFEKTDDASENIRRYRKAQIEAREAIRKKLGKNENV